jgi:hypothetical protein
MKQSIVVTVDGDMDYIVDYLNEVVNTNTNGGLNNLVLSLEMQDVAYDSDTNTWKPQHWNG